MAVDWRLCADWLVRCKILPQNHRATTLDADVFDLAQVLRDGVLLCHLLNSLYPGAINLKDFSQRPQLSQYLCVKNIRRFLCTCSNLFELKEGDLFNSDDLFDVKDFGKVIHTLSKLSKTPLALRSNISGFPQENVSMQESDYYNLEDRAVTGGDFTDGVGDLFYSCLYNQSEAGQQVYSNYVEPETEQIYDVLCQPSANQQAPSVISQKISTTAFFSERSSPLNSCALDKSHLTSGNQLLTSTPEPKSKRDYCLQELVETERNYEVVLEMITQKFLRPLEKKLRQEDLNIIFLHIENLLKVHSDFLRELKDACVGASSGSAALYRVFIKYKTRFLIYGEYCSNLMRAQEQIQSSPYITQLVEECQQNANDGKFRLRDLLHVPMQRVLKYHLLLKELIKQTDRKAIDRDKLEAALDAMQDLSLYINEVKRDNESLQMFEDIQRSIVDLQMPENTHLKNYGRLLMDGELKVKPHDDNSLKMRYIFLFDKVMLMCRARTLTMEKLIWGEQYSYKLALKMNEYKVDETRKPTKGRDRWSYQFILFKNHNQTACTFYAKTEESRSKWIDAIYMALDNETPHGYKDGNHLFEMHTFEKPTSCDVCGKLLRGVFFQGYLCQVSKVAVHKECVAKAKPCQLNGAPIIPPRKATTLPPTAASPRLESKGTIIGRCKAKYPFKGHGAPSNKIVLTFERDEIIDLLNNDDEYWWKGHLDGFEGYFPSNCVDVLAPRKLNSYEPPKCIDSRTPVPIISSAASASATISSPLSSNDINSFPWYVGLMSRGLAMSCLESHNFGVFIIRESDNRKGEYSLSVKAATGVKHIKIEKTSDNCYYLADCKVFRSIQDLVAFYQENTLQESFPELATKLVTPYFTAIEQQQNNTTHHNGASNESPILGYCTALYDYAARATNQISLKPGDNIAIISMTHQNTGWWKGKLHDKVGYFPRAYVQPQDEEPAV